MKLTLLSKTIGTLGLIAALSAVVGTGVQQAAQAQAETDPLSQLDSVAQAERQARYCAGDRSFSVVPEQYQVGDGTIFAYDFMGIEFSPEQDTAYEKITAEATVAAAAIMERTATQQDLVNGPVSFASYGDVPSDVQAKIDAVYLPSNADRTIPSQQRADTLNEQFGQYGEFTVQVENVFTPEQIIENEQMDRDIQAATLAILEPKQQQVYLENLSMKSLMGGSCDDEQLADS